MTFEEFIAETSHWSSHEQATEEDCPVDYGLPDNPDCHLDNGMTCKKCWADAKTQWEKEQKCTTPK
jgi:hypothetical protein